MYRTTDPNRNTTQDILTAIDVENRRMASTYTSLAQGVGFFANDVRAASGQRLQDMGSRVNADFRVARDRGDTLGMDRLLRRQDIIRARRDQLMFAPCPVCGAPTGGCAVCKNDLRCDEGV